MCLSKPKTPDIKDPARLEQMAMERPTQIFLTKRARKQTSSKGATGTKALRRGKNKYANS